MSLSPYGGFGFTERGNMADDKTENNMEFLGALQTLQENAQAARDWLMGMSGEVEEKNPELALKLRSAAQLINVQNDVIVKFCEEQFEVLDSLQDLNQKVEDSRG